MNASNIRSFWNSVLCSGLLALPLAGCAGESDAPRPDESTPAAREEDPEGAIPQSAPWGPAEYDASGPMPCAVTGAELTYACEFRVVRGEGTAAVWIRRPDQPEATILDFDDGEFKSRSGLPVATSKEDDVWTLDVGSVRYRFPEAVIFGG